MKKKKYLVLLLFLIFSIALFGVISSSLNKISKNKASISDLTSPRDNTQELKVLVIEINPILYTITDKSLYPNNNGHPKVSEYFGQDVDQHINELKTDIEESSHGYLNITIERKWLNEFPTYNQKKVLLKNGNLAYKFDEETYIEMSRVSGKNYGNWYNMLSTDYFMSIDHNNYDFFDYNYIINKYNLINRRKNGDFDQVWLMNISPLGTAETKMIGKNAYWINGTPMTTYVNGNGETKNVDCDNFVIAGFEIARPDSMFHSFGHMTEQIMKAIYGQPHGDIYEENLYSVNSVSSYNQLNYWEKFSLTSYNNSNSNYTGVGNTHFAFNSTDSYNYDNLTKVKTNWREWLNYPNVSGQSFKEDNDSAWLNNDINSTVTTNRYYDRLYQRFWFSLMPHIAGYTSDGFYNNWWKYWYSLDYATSIKNNNSSSTLSHKVGATITPNYSVNYYSGEKETYTKIPNGNNVKIANTSVLGFKNGYLYGKGAGSSKVTVYYDGKSISYTVNVSKSDDQITVTSNTYTYDGSTKTANITSLSNSTLTSVYYSDSSCQTKTTTTNATTAGGAPKNAGTYFVKVTSSGNDSYNGTTSVCSKAVVINTASNTIESVTPFNVTYDGKSHSPTVKTKFGGYSITYHKGSCNGATVSEAKEIGTYYGIIVTSSSSNYTPSGTCELVGTINEVETIDISRLKIKKSKYVLVNYGDKLKTITDLLGTTNNISATRNNSQLSTTTIFKTNDVLKVNNTNYTITILGDVNEDGIVTISDVSKIYRASKGTATLTEIEAVAGDYNENGTVNITDVSGIYRMTK